MEKVEYIERLTLLFKLDVDAVNAYNESLHMISEKEIREQITAFRDEHSTHINNILSILRDFGAKPPDQHSGINGFFITKLAFTENTGTENALIALQKGEQLSTMSYEIAVELPFPPEIKSILDKNYRDELKHKRYIDHALDIGIWNQ